ncbi:MAG: hypothetical protein M1389_13615 [Chloroflexi bacterium]|nr:hypothetical protein [Chloroflexota bacterium]
MIRDFLDAYHTLGRFSGALAQRLAGHRAKLFHHAVFGIDVDSCRREICVQQKGVFHAFAQFAGERH